MSCANFRNLLRENVFSSVYNLHILFEGYRHFRLSFPVFLTFLVLTVAHMRITQTNLWSVRFKYQCRSFSPGCVRQEEKSECKHRWRRGTFPALNITLCFVFWVQCHFLTNRTCVREGLRDFSITFYIRNLFYLLTVYLLSDWQYTDLFTISM
jgi:hypothetical protein